MFMLFHAHTPAYLFADDPVDGSLAVAAVIRLDDVGQGVVRVRGKPSRSVGEGNDILLEFQTKLGDHEDSICESQISTHDSTGRQKALAYRSVLPVIPISPSGHSSAENDDACSSVS